MLEKILSLDCKKLGESDPLNITINDNSRQRTLQYLSLVEAFSSNVVREFYPDVKTDSIAGDVSSTIIRGEHIEVLMRDNEGMEEVKINYSHVDEKIELLLTKLEILFDFLNKGNLRKTKPFQNGYIGVTYRSEYYEMTVYDVKDKKIISFEKDGQKEYFEC